MSILFGLNEPGFASIKQKSNAPGYVEPAAEKFTTFNFLPKFGYFVINNLAIGLDACIASSSEKSGDGSKYSTTYFGWAICEVLCSRK